jgi:putative transposase
MMLTRRKLGKVLDEMAIQARGSTSRFLSPYGAKSQPDLNAYAGRSVRSIEEGCLSQMIFFSERQLRTAVGQFVEHYHSERNHQGLANRLIEPEVERDNGTGKVVCESRLGGLLNHYRRAA